MASRLRTLSPDYLGAGRGVEGWSAGLHRAGTYDIGQTAQWAGNWWRTYGPGATVAKTEWFLLLDSEAGCGSAVWPFMIRSRYGMRIVHWVGQVDGMITDYSGAVLPPPDASRATRRLLEHLAATARLWDVADLRVPAWSGQLSWLIREAALLGPRLGLAWEVQVADAAVVVDLSGGLEGYLASLGKRTREDVARALRAADRAHFGLTVHQGTAALRSLASLFELNSTRWNVFRRSRDRAFMEAAVADLVAAGEPVSVAQLSDRGRVAAAVLGFETAGRCFLHPAGVSHGKVGGLSTGLTLYALLIQRLASRGVPALDLSPGLEEYKLRLGNRVEPLYRFLLWHKDSRIRRWRVFDYIRRHRQRRAERKSSPVLRRPRVPEAHDGSPC